MKVYSNAFMGMNTRFVFVIPGIDKDKGDVLCHQMKAIVACWEKRLSRFNPHADLFQLNQAAVNNWVEVPEYLVEILNLCEDYHKKTGGLFDPGYASVYDLLKRGENRKADAIQTQCGWDQLEWKRESRSLRFHSKYLQLDFGSIGKGIALQEVLQYLKSEGVASAFLSFGESSLAGIGSHPFGTGWPILISESLTDSEVSLLDNCVSLSGIQEISKKVQAHIYHPLQSQLIARHEIVAVKCACPIQAEILSTTIYMADAAERDRLIKMFPETEILWENQK